MNPDQGGALIPRDDDEWDDIRFANQAAGTIPAKKNRRTGHIVLEGGTINPPYKPQIVLNDPSPISFVDSIVDFRPIEDRLDRKNKDDVFQACVEWAALDKSRGTTLDSFLGDRFGRDHGVLLMSKSSFNKSLKRAYERGLIDKGPNKRWKPRTGT